MMLQVTKSYGGSTREILVEVAPIERNLWQVLSTATLEVAGRERVYARNGDLIRLFRKSSAKESRPIYLVYDLATARRAESRHIRDSVEEALHRIDYWLPRLMGIVSELEDWRQLSEGDKRRIIRELQDFRWAFVGTKSWQQVLALQKVTKFQDLRDKRMRRNPQAALRAIGSARSRLLDYRRILLRSAGVNGRLKVTLDLLHGTYKRRFAELRRLLQLGFSADEAVTEIRIREVREIIHGFTLNPWLRPAQEASRRVDLAVEFYRHGERRVANQLLRSIPVLFSCEARLTKLVELVHRLLDYGATPLPETAILAADRLYPTCLVLHRISKDCRAGGYQKLANDLLLLVTDAELAFRIGKVKQARATLREIERRIRAH